jgi:hypothetical protein
MLYAVYREPPENCFCYGHGSPLIKLSGHRRRVLSYCIFLNCFREPHQSQSRQSAKLFSSRGGGGGGRPRPPRSSALGGGSPKPPRLEKTLILCICTYFVPAAIHLVGRVGSSILSFSLVTSNVNDTITEAETFRYRS